jgi:SAM-dependent methyltransferase
VDGGEPHSAVFFGAVRDFWWNVDQLELCARRIGVDDVRSVLDVGSGVGHWGRLLRHVLAPDVTLVGIDAEQAWVEEATRQATAAGLADRFSYLQATAEALPFDDESFDLVTCQTVLIHVSDPLAVVREMTRVTRPGGLVVASEPNNRALTLIDSSVTAGSSVDERIDLVRFYLTCEQGKVALGEGDNSVGDLVTGFLADAGLEGVQSYQSDKVSLMLPPYDGEEAQAFKQWLAEDADRGAFGWTRAEALRYYEAGGGDTAEFDAAWERRVAESRAHHAAVETGDFRSGGGDLLYLVAGRRPSS